jgi:hypothetical protein
MQLKQNTSVIAREKRHPPPPPPPPRKSYEPYSFKMAVSTERQIALKYYKEEIDERICSSFITEEDCKVTPLHGSRFLTRCKFVADTCRGRPQIDHVVAKTRWQNAYEDESLENEEMGNVEWFNPAEEELLEQAIEEIIALHKTKINELITDETKLVCNDVVDYARSLTKHYGKVMAKYILSDEEMQCLHDLNLLDIVSDED